MVVHLGRRFGPHTACCVRTRAWQGRCSPHGGAFPGRPFEHRSNHPPPRGEVAGNSKSCIRVGGGRSGPIADSHWALFEKRSTLSLLHVIVGPES